LVPHERYLIEVPDGMALSKACLLPCSGLTAYSAIKKVKTNASQFVVIIGMGGVGLMALKLAKVLLQSTIICLDIDEEKLQVASAEGAHYVFNSRDKDVSRKIRTLTKEKGVECVVDFVGAPATLNLGISCLRKAGKVLLVGLFGGEARLALPAIPLRAWTIQGIHTGTYADLLELVHLVHRTGMEPYVGQTYQGLASTEQALLDLSAGRTLGRAVICPHGSCAKKE
jgi:propanol-preferring alcohol dehydrogenase